MDKIIKTGFIIAIICLAISFFIGMKYGEHQAEARKSRQEELDNIFSPYKK